MPYSQLNMYIYKCMAFRVRSNSDYQRLKNGKGTQKKGQGLIVEYFILPCWKILEYMNVFKSCKAKEIRSILIMCVFCFNCNCKPEPQLYLLTLVCSGGDRQRIIRRYTSYLSCAFLKQSVLKCSTNQFKESPLLGMFWNNNEKSKDSEPLLTWNFNYSQI